MEKPKLCIECKYYSEEVNWRDGYARYCYHDIRVSLVTGEQLPKLCSNERTELGDCGESGRFWEPKDATD